MNCINKTIMILVHIPSILSLSIPLQVSPQTNRAELDLIRISVHLLQMESMLPNLKQKIKLTTSMGPKTLIQTYFSKKLLESPLDVVAHSLALVWVLLVFFFTFLYNSSPLINSPVKSIRTDRKILTIVYMKLCHASARIERSSLNCY